MRTISGCIPREFGDIRSLQHPWRASTDLVGLQSADCNHAVHCHRRDVQTLRGLQQGDFSPFRPFSFSEDLDFMVIAERADARFAPSVAVARDHATAIEQSCDLSVGYDTRQLADLRDEVDAVVPAIVASFGNANLQLESSVRAALPMHDKPDPAIFFANDDFVDSHSQNSLLHRGRRRGVRPGGLKIVAKAAERFLFFSAKRRRLFREQRGNVIFDFLLRLKGGVPAALQLASHQPIGWINGVVLPAGMSDIERRLL